MPTGVRSAVAGVSIAWRLRGVVPCELGLRWVASRCEGRGDGGKPERGEQASGAVGGAATKATTVRRPPDGQQRTSWAKERPLHCTRGCESLARSAPIHGPMWTRPAKCNAYLQEMANTMLVTFVAAGVGAAAALGTVASPIRLRHTYEVDCHGQCSRPVHRYNSMEEPRFLGPVCHQLHEHGCRTVQYRSIHFRLALK